MKYYLLRTFRDKMTIFWSFLFPIFLATALLQSIGSASIKDTITMMISPTNSDKFIYEKIFEKASNPDKITFKLIEGNDYIDALNKKEITAFLDENNNLIVGSSSTRETIIKSFVDSVCRSKVDPEATINAVSNMRVDVKNDIAADKEGFIFALIAMLSFYGSFNGQEIVNNIQANLKPHAIRYSISPSNKWKYLIIGFISSIIMNIMIFSTTTLYLKYILKSDTITNLPLTFLIFLIGTIFSTCFGLIHAYFVNMPEGLRDSLNVIVMLLLSAGAGLNGVHLRAGLLHIFGSIPKYNPLKIITDALFKVNMQNNPDIISVLWLIPVSALIFFICGLKIRRTQYDSI